MASPKLEESLRQLEATASSFATRFVRMAHVRSAYIEQIGEMSRSIRSAVETGELSASRGAEIANQMRNQIMEMQRARDFDLGRSLARRMKSRGIRLEEAITKTMRKLKLEGKPFNQITGQQQRQVLMEVIESAGRSRPSVTQKIPRLRWAGRGLWLATFAIAAYNIGTAENPWWQTGRETANIAGGITGGFAGGAAMGAVGGLWAGPVGVAVGILVGGGFRSLTGGPYLSGYWTKVGPRQKNRERSGICRDFKVNCFHKDSHANNPISDHFGRVPRR